VTVQHQSTHDGVVLSADHRNHHPRQDDEIRPAHTGTVVIASPTPTSNSKLDNISNAWRN
jgi:hypothetical protein